MILKINDGCTEDINDNIHDLRENILCMLPFEKVMREMLIT